MFGFVLADYNTLSEADKKTYKGYYCGLCRELKNNFGFYGRLTLNYDMTFLALFLSGYYGSSDECEKFVCPIHPLKKCAMVKNRFFEYAANMNILLTYHKLCDDISDDNSKRASVLRKRLFKAYCAASAKYSAKNDSIVRLLKELDIIEKNDEHNPDVGASRFGGIMGELFDIFGNDKNLYDFGFRLGKVIYIMDACVDFKRDIKKCRYNPMVEIPCKNFQQILTILLADCTRIYDNMDMKKHKSIIENILFCGIWQKFREMNK